MSSSRMDPYHFLQEALRQNARAQQTFDVYLEQTPQGDGLKELQFSFDATKSCLQMLNRLPWKNKDSFQVQQKLQYFEQSWSELNISDLEPVQEESLLQRRLASLRQYDQLLKALHRTLYRMAKRHARVDQHPEHWKQLLQTYASPRDGYRYLSLVQKVLARATWRFWLASGSSVFTIMLFAAFIYFWTPYDAEVHLETRNASQNTQVSSLFEANGEHQSLQLALNPPQTVEQLQLSLDLRSERTFHLKEIHLLDSDGNTLHSFIFTHLQRERWQMKRLTYAGGYLFHDSGFEQLEMLSQNPQQVQKLAQEAGIEEEVTWNPEWIHELKSLHGKKFVSKASLHDALDQLENPPDWKQRKFLRNLFKQPVYRTKKGDGAPQWISPKISPVSNVAMIQIEAQMNFPAIK